MTYSCISTLYHFTNVKSRLKSEIYHIYNRPSPSIGVQACETHRNEVFGVCSELCIQRAARHTHGVLHITETTQ